MAVRKSGQKKPSGRASKGKPPAAPKQVAPPPASPTTRGPVDAPGKHHRKPPPQERVNRMMGKPEGKKMGQKSFMRGNPRAPRG